jgi:NADPH-dependent glutamate synthase beta subunit-like oxidoreductase
MITYPSHFVCIIGGAVAGSEAAYRLSQRGIYSVVFEQSALPYGKIEDGLPKWHIKLRDQEERKIDEKLTQPRVFFVPKTKLGRDIDFQDLVDNWGFSAILLAIGAWRDRPLPIAGIDDYIGRGFCYQNPFVTWFNHYHEPDYDGPQFEIHDDAIVVGGGLASLDVVKIVMLETTLRALTERGYQTDLFTLEREGIAKVLDRFGVTLSDLGLKGCTLFYRRRAIDMPLAEMPRDATPERREKVYQGRKKILRNFQAKYLFRFQERRVPVDMIVEGDRLAGLVFRETEIVDGRVVPIPGSEHPVHSPLTISSIGSVPDQIPGLPMEGELFRIKDTQSGQLEGYDNVFALGNTVTGRGNIKASLAHGRQVSDQVMDYFLAWREQDYEELLRRGALDAELKIEEISDLLSKKKLLSVDQIESIIDRIRDMQRRVGYDGDYKKWIASHRPVRLEELLAAV